MSIDRRIAAGLDEGPGRDWEEVSMVVISRVNPEEIRKVEGHQAGWMRSGTRRRPTSWVPRVGFRGRSLRFLCPRATSRAAIAGDVRPSRRHALMLIRVFRKKSRF
jgi:hypothetical protein